MEFPKQVSDAMCPDVQPFFQQRIQKLYQWPMPSTALHVFRGAQEYQSSRSHHDVDRMSPSKGRQPRKIANSAEYCRTPSRHDLSQQVNVIHRHRCFATVANFFVARLGSKSWRWHCTLLRVGSRSSSWCNCLQPCGFSQILRPHRAQSPRSSEAPHPPRSHSLRP